MTDTVAPPTSYGWATGPSKFGPRGVIARPERSGTGNVILRAGNEVDPPGLGWTQVAHVVLEPEEARALIADMERQLDPDAPVGAQPPPPAVLHSYVRDDGALVLTIKPAGGDLAAYPLVVYIGDDVVVDETAAPQEDA